MRPETAEKITQARERIANGENITDVRKELQLSSNTWYKYGQANLDKIASSGKTKVIRRPRKIQVETAPLPIQMSSGKVVVMMADIQTVRELFSL